MMSTSQAVRNPSEGAGTFGRYRFRGADNDDDEKAADPGYVDFSFCFALSEASLIANI